MDEATRNLLHGPDRCDGLHRWQRDPQQRGEGLACARCGVTEAESAATPPPWEIDVPRLGRWDDE